MTSMPSRCASIATSLPSSPDPSSSRRRALGDRGVPRLIAAATPLRALDPARRRPLPGGSAASLANTSLSHPPAVAPAVPEAPALVQQDSPWRDAILESALDCIIIMDSAGVVREFNP